MSYLYHRRCQCGALVYGNDPHTCPPVWLVYADDYGETPEDARRVYALDAQRAAETAVEQHYWSFDTSALALDVLVRPEADNAAAWQSWCVEIEMTPVFVGRKQKEQATA